ncbi:MAG: ATP-binding protein [Rhodospirillales bacterium]|nr:ATP-binding protein [Rhodospirillales bacterium]
MAALSVTTFEFRTPDEIVSVINSILNQFPHLEYAELAISEMMINAVEHGNLGISYKEKSALLKTDAVYTEIARRLQDPKYKNRTASIEIKEMDDETVVFICDEGDGFAWKDYLDKDLSEAKGLHGRGISLSVQYCKILTYIGNGNKVIAVFDRAED